MMKPVWAKSVPLQVERLHRSILNPVSPVVLSVQLRLTCVVKAVVAVRFEGAVAGGRATLARFQRDDLESLFLYDWIR
jgi:hypothetical protein